MAQEPRTAQERALELLRATVATSRWQPTITNMTKVKRLVWAIRGAIVLGLVVLVASAVDKTLWDYLELLIVPAAIAIGVAMINGMQSKRQADANRAQEERELEVARQRAQDAALQAYLNQMGQLLTDKYRPLRGARLGDDLSTVARAWTLTMLTRLDGKRKKSIVQFLYESKLIDRGHPVVSLKGADLSHANLERMNLDEADLSGTNLWYHASLIKASLVRADLRGAELIPGNSLNQADLEGADLREAVLDDDYKDARVHAQPGGAFTGAPPDGLVHIWGETYSWGAKFEGAYPYSRHDMDTQADTQLGATNLKGANLHDAKLTDKQLAECKSLEGATMPDGWKYEDWLGTPQGQEWIRKYKKNLGADKKRAGVYEDWIKTPEGKMWLRAIG